MGEPAFHLVARWQFENNFPDLDFNRLGYKLSALQVDYGLLEVIHRVWDASYNEPWEDFLSDALDPYVTVGDDLRTERGGLEAGTNTTLIRVLECLDYDLESYELWSKPENRDRYPYAAEYEEHYGPDVPGRIEELRTKYTASPGGQEVLAYYRAYQWLQQDGIGVGDSW